MLIVWLAGAIPNRQLVVSGPSAAHIPEAVLRLVVAT